MLDLEFYRGYYPDLSDKSDDELKSHWESLGKEDGRLANAEEALAELIRHPDLPADFDLHAYLELNPDVAQASRWEYQGILHYLNFGGAENRSYNFKQAWFLPDERPAGNGHAAGVETGEGVIAEIIRVEITEAVADESAEAETAEDDAAVALTQDLGRPAKADRWADVAGAAKILGEAADRARQGSGSFVASERTVVDSLVRVLVQSDRSVVDSLVRDRWREFLEELGDLATVEDFLRGHHNAAALEKGFSLASYLARYPDVAASVDKPIFAVFHFLEFGLVEGRSGAPEEFDPKFVRGLYGLELDPEETTPVEALQAIQDEHGLTPFDLVYLTETELAARHGVRVPQFFEIFDHEFYRAVALGREGGAYERAKCLAHFLQQGQYVPHDINSDWAFDPEFYWQEYGAAIDLPPPVEEETKSAAALLDDDAADDAEPSDEDETETEADDFDPQESKAILFHDWLTIGLPQGRAPSLDIWSLRNYGFKIPPSIKAQLDTYREVEDGLSSTATPTEVSRHLIEQAGSGLNKLRLDDYASADFIAGIADRLSTSGNLHAADRLYFRVLTDFPQHGQALRHRADQVQRTNLIGLAVELRRKIIDEGLHNIWSYITLAECYTKLGDDLAAAESMRRGACAYPADVGIRSRARSLALKAFHTLWSSSVALALGRGIQSTQNDLRRALEIYTPRYEPPKPARKIRSVAIVGNEDLPQCKLYRLDQKVEHLAAAGYRVETFNFNKDLTRYLGRLGEFDATIFYRVPAFPPVVDAIAKTSEYGVATFYEIDDLIFDPAHFPPSFESYADQITREQHASLACGVPLFEYAMTLCEYGIASTTPLQKLMAERVRSGKVFLHRNALGYVHEEAIRLAGPRKEQPVCTIFYGSGTKAHKQDFHDLVEPALVEIVRRHGDKVRIVIVGYIALTEQLKTIEDQIVLMEPVWDVEDYYLNLVSQADINLSVLEPSLLADCKSEIKWLEAAMFGIPSVVSDTQTHREVIEHGRTGYLCHSAAEFTEAIDLLVSDPSLRRKVGEAARAEALEKYSIASQARNIRGILESVSPSAARKRRILIVNVFYPPQAIGGATRVVYDNVTDLVNRFGDEYEVTVLCTLDGGQVPYEINHYAHEGVRVFTISSPSDPDIDKKVSDPKMAEAFSACLDAIEPELIHFHCIQRLTASIVEVARRRKIPYFITAHDGWWISPNQFLVGKDDEIETYDYHSANLFAAQRGEKAPSARAVALRKPLIGATKILAVSKEFADIYASTGLSNVATVENGVSRLPSVIRTASPDGRVRLAHIGGAARHKGYHLVRYALSANAFENLRLTVIDHALPKGAVRHEVWGKTPVTFMAKFDQGKVGDLYGQIDVLLAPSIWPESYGLVTREALASGCWVVASDRGAIGACVEDGVNGYRIDVSSHLGLVEAFERINEQPADFTRPPRKTTALRTAVEQAEEIAGWYKSVLGPRRLEAVASPEPEDEGSSAVGF